MISFTSRRTAGRLIPSDFSAFAATPSPSWIRPSSRCSVPMWVWFSILASSWARTTTRRARSVNRSNMRNPSSDGGDPDQAVAGDQRRQRRLVEVPGAGRAAREVHVARLRAGIPDIDLQVRSGLEAELAQDPARV